MLSPYAAEGKTQSGLRTAFAVAPFPSTTFSSLSDSLQSTYKDYFRRLTHLLAAMTLERQPTNLPHAPEETLQVAKRLKGSKEITIEAALPPVDRLSTLPPELLLKIFKLVRQDHHWTMIPGGLSRFLLPFQEICFYEDIEFYDFDSVRLFAAMIGVGDEHSTDQPRFVRGQYLSSLIKCLSFGCHNPWEPGWATFDAVQLFSHLKQLTVVKIDDCPTFSNAILSEICAKQLTFLKHLTLGFWFDEEDELRRAVSLGYLHLYSNLRSLDLEFRYWNNLPSLDHLPKRFIFPVHDFSLQLHLVYTSTVELSAFFSYFAKVKKLSLTYQQENFGPDIDWAIVFEAAHFPLHELYFEEEYSLGGDPLPAQLETVLSNLPDLRRLHLDLDSDISFVIPLHVCSSLKIVEFGSSNQSLYLPFNTMMHLVDQSRCSGLEELIVAHNVGHRGRKLQDCTKLPRTPYEVNWSLPEWEQHFSFEKATEFIDAATKAGLRVSGSLLEAIEVQKEWNDGIVGILFREGFQV